jgi:hypothetical protein
MNVAESSMANLLAAGVYSDGTAASNKQIDGLLKQVPTDPTTGVVGGIDRQNWNFWRSKVFKATTTGGGATTPANIQKYMNTLWGNLVRGNDRPDLIPMDAIYWGFYMNSLQAIQRFTGTEDAKLGFVTIKFMDADCILDGGIGGFMPASTLYMLNTKYLHYRPHAQRNMVPLSPGQRYSVNQDAAVQILAWAGNLTASGLQFQGKMFE